MLQPEGKGGGGSVGELLTILVEQLISKVSGRIYYDNGKTFMKLGEERKGGRDGKERTGKRRRFVT